jgi:hypothetical protein
MNQRTKKLRDLMEAHKLRAADVGQMLGRKAQTVRVWACSYDAQIIPQDALELLEFKLAARGVAA